MTNYHFGIEIEVLVEPHTIRAPLDHALYYDKLSKSLRKRGLKAVANDLQPGGRRRRPDLYDKWWITRDGSLDNSGANIGKMLLSFLIKANQLLTGRLSVPMEAVSPVMNCRATWESEIDTFWKAMSAVFHMPQRSPKCGSHIHISNTGAKSFSLDQLKTIAFGVVLYEPLISECLMSIRTTNGYCQPNSAASTKLRSCGGPSDVARLIRGAANRDDLVEVMQDDRRVLWNFENVVRGKSGTIEFRGGRCLRGPVRTKRWIAFAVALIHAILDMVSIPIQDYEG